MPVPKRRSSPPSRRDPAGAAILLAATPLLIGGAVALAVLLSSRALPVHGWVKSLFGSRTKAMRKLRRGYAQGRESFSSLRNAILGSAKGAVANVFGPPRTAMLGRGTNRMSIWRAETWYYPLDRRARSVLAIRFERNVAREVELINAPREVRMTKSE